MLHTGDTPNATKELFLLDETAVVQILCVRRFHSIIVPPVLPSSAIDSITQHAAVALLWQVELS